MKKSRFGFWRVVLWILAVLVVLAGGFVVFVSVSSSSAKGEVEKTRQDLKKQGFKTDLAEFDFAVPSNERGFEMCVERMMSVPMMGRRPLPQVFGQLALMRRAGPDAAIVTWKEDSVTAGNETYSWTEYRAGAQLNDPDFAEARAAAFSEPIRFSLEANQGMSMLLRNAPGMRLLSQDLSAAMIIDLHGNDRAAAWTNLVAATRLVTAWEPEPADVSHVVRFALVPGTFQLTWEALQAGNWQESQLAELQRQWESVDFFKNLPETLAFQRAGLMDLCERQRKERVEGFKIGEIFKEMADNPREIPQMARMLWTEWKYLNGGVYEDERSLLLFYRDREVEMRNALKATSWQAMKSMPGVTNELMFTSKYRSSVAAMLSMRQMNPAFANRGIGLLGRAAQAESYRRLIITAIALERFRGRRGHYPASLDELMPEFLKQPPLDFMDGQPLRYRLGVDDRFVLYSTGVDCVDDGGVIAKPPANSMRRNFAGLPGTEEAGDIVWPRVATSNEVVVLREAELQERQSQAEFSQRIDSENYWNRTTTRQVRADSSFVTPEAEVNANTFNGGLVSDILRNENLAETNTLMEMLTLRPVITGTEGETITFEAPINYDALTNIGTLELLVDLNKGDALEEGEGAAAQVEVSRATNGNCLVAWHTIFDAPGRHTLQMGLFLESGTWRKVVAGPTATMEVTNLCQFSESSAHFDSATGAWLFAKAPESKANYSVEILSPEGKRVKTINGTTSNGEIEVFWDLIGDDQKKLGDQSFSTVFHITLPESGRTQTLKGP